MGYVDPGSFGVLSQIGYVMLLTIMTGLMFFFSPIKKAIRKLRKRTDEPHSSDGTVDRAE